MKIPKERPWSAAVRAAIATQKTLAESFRDTGFPQSVRYIGGADIAFAKATDGTRTGSVGCDAIGIAIIYDLVDQRLIDAAYIRAKIDFPYVPGLLSFREAPILEAAIAQLRHPADAWMFDGQGRSHPRGVGLATHMGIRLEMPSIGAAKSVLLGRYDMPAPLQKEIVRRQASKAPSKFKSRLTFPLTAPLLHNEIEIARALWMTPRTEPMIISQGHRCTLDQALATTIAATRPGHWMPEPTRLADELTKRTRDLPEAEARTLVLAQIPT